MSYLTDDIQMAAVNAAKVVNLEESVKEANRLLDSHLADSAHTAVIQDALSKIKDIEDYQVQPELVVEVDEVINNVGNILVSRGDQGISVSGTESFGITLTPKEWRRTRIQGCESILEELGKTLKVYANKLSETLSEIFTSNRYTIDGLSERLEEANKKLTFIETPRPDIEFVSIPEAVSKVLSINSNTIVTQPTVEKMISSEVNYFGMIMKSWVQETVLYKNKLIRFFGNKGRGDYMDLYRLHPKFVSKKCYIDEDNSNEVTWIIPNGFLGGGALFFTENARKPESLSELPTNQLAVGYRIVKPSDVKYPRPIPELNVKPLSITQLESLNKTAALCITLMKELNRPSNDFDSDGKDIKDLLNTLKGAGDEQLMDAFGGMITHYQQNVVTTQANFIRYLGELVNAIITFMFIHMEGYDDA